jgi:hypothetical protein
VVGTACQVGPHETRAGLRSGTERRDISRLRSRLFSLQHLWIVQQRVLGSDEVLAEALGPAARRKLRRVRAVFEESGSTATQLSAMLGDTLSRRLAPISERLTFVTGSSSLGLTSRRKQRGPADGSRVVVKIASPVWKSASSMGAGRRRWMPDMLASSRTCSVEGLMDDLA